MLSPRREYNVDTSGIKIYKEGILHNAPHISPRLKPPQFFLLNRDLKSYARFILTFVARAETTTLPVEVLKRLRACNGMNANVLYWYARAHGVISLRLHASILSNVEWRVLK